jgi:hypothetical protein
VTFRFVSFLWYCKRHLLSFHPCCFSLLLLFGFVELYSLSSPIVLMLLLPSFCAMLSDMPYISFTHIRFVLYYIPFISFLYLLMFFPWFSVLGASCHLLCFEDADWHRIEDTIFKLETRQRPFCQCLWIILLSFCITLTLLIPWQDFAHYKSGVYKHITGFALGGHAVKLIGWGTSDEGEDYWVCWQFINLYLILDNNFKHMLLFIILCVLTLLLFTVSASCKSVEYKLGGCMFLELFFQLE